MGISYFSTQWPDGIRGVYPPQISAPSTFVQWEGADPFLFFSHLQTCKSYATIPSQEGGNVLDFQELVKELRERIARDQATLTYLLKTIQPTQAAGSAKRIGGVSRKISDESRAAKKRWRAERRSSKKQGVQDD